MGWRLVILVTGDRYWTDEETVTEVLEAVLDRYEIDPAEVLLINGGAKGLDLMAKRVAYRLGMKTRTVFANWRGYGRSAGHKRNTKMLDMDPNLVLAFHDELWTGSKGTKNCVEQAQERELPVVTITSSQMNSKDEWVESLEGLNV